MRYHVLYVLYRYCTLKAVRNIPFWVVMMMKMYEFRWRGPSPTLFLNFCNKTIIHPFCCIFMQCWLIMQVYLYCTYWYDMRDTTSSRYEITFSQMGFYLYRYMTYDKAVLMLLQHLLLHMIILYTCCSCFCCCCC